MTQSLELSPEIIKLQTEVTTLEKELGKVILEQDEMINVVKPNLEAEYQKTIGYKELECMENEIASRRLKRQIELLQATEPPAPNTHKLKPMVMKESLFSGSSLENEFQPGHDVYHAHFGEVQVTSVDGSGESAKITVKFKKGDTKMLVAKFANLKRYKRVT